ncbi:MAG: recombinase family protein [Chloroflexi bacterium]|nr:recombinase family protein [Chloroflexota bacterium]
MTASQKTPKGTEQVPAKHVALVLRVSTDRQAQNDEGSLKNQLQRLRQHIEYKTVTCGEEWIEAGVYELKGVSGKNSMRSREFERLFADVRAGRINTILCTALDRICRSVKDFLWFFEFLNEQRAEFVCLKQNYDTTSAQGRLFVTMMMALAEFEREQTSERNRDATAARAERGLWNGGRLLGYDADPNKKSSLVPNSEESAIVNFAFDTYLECGAITKTTEALNRRGYRTKSYTSRRGIYRPGAEFYDSTVQYLLKNPAYIGKKEINKGAIRKKGGNGKEYRLVDAVWPAIVSAEKFEAAQRLMAENGQTKRNAATPIQHSYVLSRGILRCGRCGTTMEGRCGTGRLGIRYFDYVCQKKECSLHVAADEVEGAVLDRIRQLASDGDLLQRLTAEANTRLLRQKPSLEKRRQGLLKSLAEVKAQADRLLDRWSGLEEHAGNSFVTEKLNDLAHRRADLEAGLLEVEQALRQVQEQAVTVDVVRHALARIDEVYGQLRPFEQRELMGLVLKQAKVNEREIVLEIYALGGDTTRFPESVNQGGKVRPRTNWLPR